MRADKYFSERFGSRTKAAEALKQGLVLRDGRLLSPDSEVNEGDAFEFLSPEEQFVSNGGYKLARGLDVFQEDISGKAYCDLGASTGGFTDCLLQAGAARVYAVDVGKSQLAPSLAADARVRVMDGVNARYLRAEDFPEPIDGVTADLSFISLRLILPAVAAVLRRGGSAFVLIKPQFECGGRGLDKHGIYKDAAGRRAIAEELCRFACGLGLRPRALTAAPVLPRKNIEYVLWLTTEDADGADCAAIAASAV